MCRTVKPLPGRLRVTDWLGIPVGADWSTRMMSMFEGRWAGRIDFYALIFIGKKDLEDPREVFLWIFCWMGTNKYVLGVLNLRFLLRASPVHTNRSLNTRPCRMPQLTVSLFPESLVGAAIPPRNLAAKKFITVKRDSLPHSKHWPGELVRQT